MIILIYKVIDVFNFQTFKTLTILTSIPYGFKISYGSKMSCNFKVTHVVKCMNEKVIVFTGFYPLYVLK